jgi:PBP1b-binding outer membrane lipoprotein LpoB
MNCKSKRLATLLCLALTLSGCASTKPPSIAPVQIPPPPPELMDLLPPSPVNVEELLLRWTDMLETWQQQQQVCNSTPQACV